MSGERLFLDANFVVDTELFLRAVGFYRDRGDKRWGLTDCISFVVMRDRKIMAAATADSDFQQAGFRALMLD
jgi:predicted nucleic acid-binding protein